MREVKSATVAFAKDGRVLAVSGTRIWLTARPQIPGSVGGHDAIDQTRGNCIERGRRLLRFGLPGLGPNTPIVREQPVKRDLKGDAYVVESAD